MDWKRKPDSEGDWLWCVLYSCGCCAYKSGIGYYYGVAGEMKWSWEGPEPELNLDKVVYKKIELPDQTWYEHNIKVNVDYDDDFDGKYPQQCLVNVITEKENYTFTGLNVFSPAQIDNLNIKSEPILYYEIVLGVLEWLKTPSFDKPIKLPHNKELILRTSENV